MRIKMDMNGVEALREFARVIPHVMQDVNDRTEFLIAVINAMEGVAGPHMDEFREMIRCIQNGISISEEALKELPYALNSTADKMEAYILRKTPTEVRVLRQKTNIRDKYSVAVRRRLEKKGSNPEALTLYKKYQDRISISDYEHVGTAYYSPANRAIYIHAYEDMHNPTGAMSTFFHETGHFLDHVGGTGEKWLSSEPMYRKALEKDVRDYCRKTIAELGCEEDEVYDIVSEEISGHEMAGISDIFGSLTGGQCQGDWGHSIKYWKSDASRVEQEAFANMFEASIGDGDKQKNMRKYFPTAYAIFEDLVRRAQ